MPVGLPERALLARLGDREPAAERAFDVRAQIVLFEQELQELNQRLEQYYQTSQQSLQQAQSQKIDAEIDVKLSQVNLQKAMGTLE